MTWQRIDENTFIDDTLVTCAEYQLFIDEMRGQGKYYQPVHWTSLQFLKGQAHNPILGVGVEDVQAFCEWLTQREKGGSQYRLPTLSEAVSCPLILSNQLSTLYYWILDVDAQITLIWANQSHIKDPTILFKPVGSSSIRTDQVGDDPALLELVLHSQMANMINSYYRTRRAIVNDPTSVIPIQERIISSTADIDPQLATLIEKSLTDARSMIHDYVITRTPNPNFNPRLTIDQTIAQVYVLDIEIGKLIDRFLDVALETEQFILQIKELVSPSIAFIEGIRLVKERIK